MLYLDIDGVLLLEKDRDVSHDIIKRRASHVAWLANSLNMPIIVSSQRRISDDIMILLGSLDLIDLLYGHRDHWRTPLKVDDMDDDLSVRGQEIRQHLRVVGARRHLIIDDTPVLAGQTHLDIDPALGIAFDDRARGLALMNKAA
ncbi:HAD domain-containing protein [Croceicoccus gelatinilyticus]|uniref:HAD domain-containing protein n=1 Tax=Croceicoccus gelatinilyticus TaxID=2835536 RepID=UPI001BCEA817|nr:HAD domain-containing protein [Croceicoccus gelatinilyticus]MBS7671364.1 hypothetical protein [Croceicoccus gelatinilyticus]